MKEEKKGYNKRREGEKERKKKGDNKKKRDNSGRTLVTRARKRAGECNRVCPYIYIYVCVYKKNCN